jgi:hypothetical protein
MFIYNGLMMTLLMEQMGQFLTVFKSDGDAYTQTDVEVSKFKCSDYG